MMYTANTVNIYYEYYSAKHFIEPVLSTGVYIHPSGYSYTVAPNGVWYFHNADGTPPSCAPGAPPMAYTPTTMQKIQASQTSPTSTMGNSNIDSTVAESSQENCQVESQATTVTHPSVSVYPSHTVQQEVHSAAQQVVHPDIHYQVIFLARRF